MGMRRHRVVRAARTHLEVSSMHYCTLMISCVWHGAYVKYRIHMQSRETERCMSGPGERGGRNPWANAARASGG